MVVFCYPNPNSKKMVKLRNILLLLLGVTIVISCYSIVQSQQNNNYKRISESISFNAIVNQDTIVLGDEIFLTLVFENKSDTNYYFHSEALLYVDIYTSPENWNRGANAEIVAHYLSIPSNYSLQSSLILLKSKESYSKAYHVRLNKPLLVIGNNKLVVNYMCGNGIQKQEQKREYDILYGGLQSSAFDIFVKER